MIRRRQKGRGFLSFFKKKKKTKPTKKYYNRYQRGKGQKGGNPAAALVAKKVAKKALKYGLPLVTPYLAHKGVNGINWLIKNKL